MIDNLSTVLHEKLRRWEAFFPAHVARSSAMSSQILESRPHHALVPEARENPTLFTLLSRFAHRDLHGN